MNRKNDKKKKGNRPLVEEVIKVWKNEAASQADILGWYTGRPSQSNELYPEQDSDDL